MRRIAHVISTPEGIGGAERIMLALLADGHLRGWEQAVFDPFDIDPENSRLRFEVERVGAHYSARSTSRIVELPRARSWLRGRLEAFDPHLVHIHLFHALTLMASFPRSSWPTLLSHHHGDQLRVSGKRIREMADRWAAGRIDHVVAPSAWVRNFLVKGYGYAAERVTEIHNGWEGERSSASSRDGTECVLICVANLRPEKDHGTLLEAFVGLRRVYPSVRLLLVGDGPMRPEIEGAIGELGLGTAVELCGAVNEVWPFLARSDLFVLASRNETLGMAALEAMAAGLPVVATAVGGIPELVEHGHNGLLVPPRDPEALAEALSVLVASSEERRRMGASGKKRAGSRRMNITVNRYFELYERLLKA